MNVEQVQALQSKLDAVLADFASENKLVIGKSTAAIHNAGVDIKFGVSDAEDNPNQVDPRFLRDLRKNGWTYGLQESMVHTSASVRLKGGVTDRTMLVFMGMVGNSVVVKRPDGQLMRIAGEDIAHHFLKAFKSAK